jgi:hypothetical protein
MYPRSDPFPDATIDERECRRESDVFVRLPGTSEYVCTHVEDVAFVQR